MRNHFNVCQVAFLNPLFRILEDCNLSSENVVNKSKLKYFDLTQSEGYVPLECAYDFYMRTKYATGDNFLKSFYLGHYDLSRLGSFGNYLTKLPTLYSILYQLVSFQSIYMTNLHCNLEYYGDTTKFSYSCSDQFSAGRKIGESLYMAMILQLFRRYTDKNWEPDQIHVPYNTLGSIEALLQNYKGKVITNQTSFAIVFPRDILHRASRVFIQFSKPTLPSPPSRSVSHIIEKVLRNYKSGYIPSLSDLALHFNISESSIKRSLKSEDTRFSIILQKVLFEKSISLLTCSELSIMLISESLGYSDSPNFIRSFRKWSGVTPGQYRETHNMT